MPQHPHCTHNCKARLVDAFTNRVQIEDHAAGIIVTVTTHEALRGEHPAHRVSKVLTRYLNGGIIALNDAYDRHNVDACLMEVE